MLGWNFVSMSYLYTTLRRTWPFASHLPLEQFLIIRLLLLIIFLNLVYKVMLGGSFICYHQVQATTYLL